VKPRDLALPLILLMLGSPPVWAQETTSPAPRHITLEEAVQLALSHNHAVRIAGFKVQEKEHAKDVARSTYFPSLKNESSVAHITDLQHVEIPAGSLGNVSGSEIPPRTITLLQGAQTFETSGTSLSQPLTQLLKVKAKNDIAFAELNATRSEADETKNEVALKVRQIYYGLLIAQLHRAALDAGYAASQDAEKERVAQVKYGSALDQDLIESKAQSLQAKQELLTADLQISDLTTQLNDVIGLPLETKLALDSSAPPMREPCVLDDCRRRALQSHPEVKIAEQQVEGASAAVRLAKRDYIPNTEVFARYSYENNVPFLVHNFGTFGFLMTYEIFDGGRRRAELNEQKSALDQANENLARVRDEVQLRVRIAYDKLDRTREMVAVSQELLSLREESRRVSDEQLKRGAALQSQADLSAAHELEAKAGLMQSQLDYSQAQDELVVAIGQTPE
jgi:outer membrane protein TolC